jgi:hypothetical protein
MLSNLQWEVAKRRPEELRRKTERAGLHGQIGSTRRPPAKCEPQEH